MRAYSLGGSSVIERSRPNSVVFGSDESPASSASSPNAASTGLHEGTVVARRRETQHAREFGGHRRDRQRLDYFIAGFANMRNGQRPAEQQSRHANIRGRFGVCARAPPADLRRARSAGRCIAGTIANGFAFTSTPTMRSRRFAMLVGVSSQRPDNDKVEDPLRWIRGMRRSHSESPDAGTGPTSALESAT